MGTEPTDISDAENGGTRRTIECEHSADKLLDKSDLDITLSVSAAPQEVDVSETAPLVGGPAREETIGIIEMGLSVPPSVQLYERAHVRVRHLRANIE